jgi:prophage DNA circulation protein
MASYLDFVLPASFRGVPFNVLDSSQTGGRKTAVHDYPFKDQPFVEDLGLADKQFGLRGFLFGADCAAQEVAMHAVCGESGPGLLVHPSLGPIMVSVVDFTSSVNAEDGNMVSLEFTFIQGAASPIFPSAITDAISAISDAADVAILAASGDYAAALALAAATGGSFANSIAGITGGVATAVAPFVATATSIAGDAALTTAAVSGLAGNFGRFTSGNSSTPANPSSTVTSVLSGVVQARTAIITAGAAVTSAAALV